ncbi:TetR/AcrR family transcriptional regulator [Clavibacter sp. VKM Ac-2873]|uniref:TetR/AcrR family transcriptional regulator n=1 Tax=Clavibacter sp. VKM Ac-2873 TaxID=2783813 RepID=UPI00188C6FA6|nr:TetR/AcrR family transcriptional regulator [Clavibacter sp. VKM Ac-2873]MBF4619271.1 TetR/AcrR family transcriptional regulator [Clavibacter sp. VKM Ac-2873]
MTSTTDPAPRTRLIQAAQELFWDDGISATSPRDVMDASGVTQGSLYHHFPSKKDLARAAVSDSVQASLRSAAAQLGGGGDAHDRLVAYLTRDRAATRGCRIGRLTADPAVAADPELSGAVAGYFTDLIGLVRDVLVERGVGERSDDMAHAAVAVVQGGYVLAKATQDDEAMRAAVRGFVTLLGAGTAAAPGR